jgi:hypothetical protein
VGSAVEDPADVCVAVEGDVDVFLAEMGIAVASAAQEGSAFEHAVPWLGETRGAGGRF